MLDGFFKVLGGRFKMSGRRRGNFKKRWVVFQKSPKSLYFHENRLSPAGERRPLKRKRIHIQICTLSNRARVAINTSIGLAL